MEVSIIALHLINTPDRKVREKTQVKHFLKGFLEKSCIICAKYPTIGSIKMPPAKWQSVQFNNFCPHIKNSSELVRSLVGKDTCCKAYKFKFYLQDAYGGSKELRPASSPLISIHTQWYMLYTHINKQINTNKRANNLTCC